MNKNYVWLGAAALLIIGIFAYKSRSPVEEVKEKAGEALHETERALDRAGNRIKEAAR